MRHARVRSIGIAAIPSLKLLYALLCDVIRTNGIVNTSCDVLVFKADRRTFDTVEDEVTGPEMGADQS